MLDFILINNVDDNLGSVGEVNPYANAEMCCYTCRMVRPPVWKNCRCNIHRNDREESQRKQYTFTFDEQRYKYAFSDSHLQTDTTNMKRSNSMEILQIEPPITEKDLKRAYKKMALKTHPDKCGSNEQFIKVNEAYNELLLIC